MKVINQGFEVVPVGSIKPHPMNPRMGDLEAIGQSIDINGFYGAVVVSRRTGHILAGNHRYMAARAAGADSVPVAWVDVDEAGEQRILAADNRTSDLGGYDDAALAVLLESVSADGGLLGTGYDEGDLAKMIADLSSGLEDDGLEDTQAAGDEALDAMRLQWGVERGQVWVAGDQRLMCGDSTNPDDVAVLLGDAAPGIMVTDPPYGVSYDPSWRNEALGASGRSVGTVSNDGRADWRAAYDLFPGDVTYVWHQAGALQGVFLESLQASGFDVRMTIIWAKSHFPIGRGHYHVQHEPCFYAVRSGKSAGWSGTRKQSTLWEIEKPQKNESGHSTQKPLECMARPIRNHTFKQVYEPFSGSGTTLVACHELGVAGFGMELDPRYVAVALQRLAGLGLEPTKVRG